MSASIATLDRPVRAAVSRLNVAKPVVPHRRFAFIDALRGLAAMAVVLHHADRFGPLWAHADKLIPEIVSTGIEHARVGVRVFFVISGFVIAYSIRNAWVTPGYLGNFALRRSIRLEPPYWATILVVLTLNAICRWIGVEQATPDATWLQTFAHVFYIQEIVGYEHISIGFWTLCIELQFYLLFVAMFGIAQRLGQSSRRFLPMSMPASLAITFLPFALWSLFHSSLCHEDVNSMWLSRYFWAFFLGALVCWTLNDQAPRALLYAYLGAMVVRLGMFWTMDCAVGLITGTTIFLVGIRGHLTDWLDWRWLQYLGRISYSLYLIHFPVNHVVSNLGYSLSGDSPVAAVLWMATSVVLSIGVAHVLYKVVEAPSVRLSQRFKLAAA
jgi:peptidoglycan/LPS O-acetylase OafA/YrhL